MKTHKITGGQQAVSAENATFAHVLRSARRQILSLIRTGLVVGLTIFAAQTALAKPAILTVEYIENERLTKDTLWNTEDEIYLVVGGVKLWPTDVHARTFRTKQTHRVDMSFEFDTTTGVTLELWERDTNSPNDLIGTLEYKDKQYDPIKLPYSEFPFFSRYRVERGSVNHKNFEYNVGTYHIKLNIVATGPNCVSFYTEPNGRGKLANTCGGTTYMNLGTPGTNSHHYAVQSFKCGAGVKYVQFINGNQNPWGRHNEYCKRGMINTNPWVKANATGVAFAKK